MHPTITASTIISKEQTGASGTPVTISASASDICDADPVVTSDAPAVFPLGETTVTWTATDASGNSTSASQTVTVIDTTDPSITLVGNSEIALECHVDTYTEEGATVSDNCDTSVSVVIGGDTVDTNAAGTYIVTYDAADASGNVATQVTRTINVVDTTPPMVSDTSANPNPVGIDTAVTITAVITDLCSNISYAEYSIDGGTSWSSMNTITEQSNSVNISMEHPGFANSEVVSLCVKGYDVEGNESAYEAIYLPVYDPSAGFVTGGGWIWSPAGAYTADTTLEGKANFGFVAKYKKGKTTPDGNTEFQFKAGNLDFHSDTYDWLVVAGAKAMFKGTGTINGEGSYRFMISAIDGNLKNSGEKDTFRIRIWEEDSNGTATIIYDNEINAGDVENADPTTILGGGSIIIHDGNDKGN